MADLQSIQNWFGLLQDDICRGLEALDGDGVFREDRWSRPGGGGGRTRVITGGLIEKGGVNFSAVHGPMPEKIQNALGLHVQHFEATGVSIVLHPRNPHVPIIHMNVRYFETDGGPWWFGGGIDLTPHYIRAEDACDFHRSLKRTCDRHNAAYYPRFKSWADDYFYLKHRQETRGVGGIFFDRLTENEWSDKNDLFAFVQDVGRLFVPLYAEQVARHRNRAFSEQEKRWQLIRRGRYVEFNLVWDKGTKFGLDTDGRSESILMSLPPLASWIYDFQVESGSSEARTLSYLRKDIDWLKDGQ